MPLRIYPLCRQPVGRLVKAEPECSVPLGKGDLYANQSKSPTLAAMERARIHPCLVYAYRRTGRILSESSERNFTEREVAEFDLAVDEYAERHNIKWPPRRFSFDDFQSVLLNGPRRRVE